MCHDRWFRRHEREERFEEELRFLLNQEAERSKPATPVVEREPDTGPVAEPEPDKEPAPSS